MTKPQTAPSIQKCDPTRENDDTVKSHPRPESTYTSYFFFRNVLGIYQLALLTLPVVQPCENPDSPASIAADYSHVIYHLINKTNDLLSKEIQNGTCPENKTNPCEQGNEIDKILQLACALQQTTKKIKLNKDLQTAIVNLSEHIKRSMRCSCEERKASHRSSHQKQKASKICRLKRQTAHIELCYQRLNQKSR